MLNLVISLEDVRKHCSLMNCFKKYPLNFEYCDSFISIQFMTSNRTTYRWYWISVHALPPFKHHRCFLYS